MNGTERAILEALLELEQVAGRARAEGGPGKGGGILPILDRIDRLASELPPDAPGDLRHYLQRKSYEKARLFLQGRGHEATPGACGRGGPDASR